MMISEQALLKRINRKLAHQGEVLRKLRTWETLREPHLGEFVVIDVNTGGANAENVDPVALALKLGVVREWMVEEVSA